MHICIFTFCWPCYVPSPPALYTYTQTNTFIYINFPDAAIGKRLCICVCVHLCAHMCECMCVCARVCVCAWRCVSMCRQMCVCGVCSVWTCVCVCICVCACVCLHACTSWATSAYSHLMLCRWEMLWCSSQTMRTKARHDSCRPYNRPTTGQREFVSTGPCRYSNYAYADVANTDVFS